jgi:hypothetical protein
MLAGQNERRHIIMTLRAGPAALSFAEAVALSTAASARDEDDARNEGLETEHLFVFASGTDVGQVGDREIELESEGHFGKGTGSYAAFAYALALQFVPLPTCRSRSALPPPVTRSAEWRISTIATG